MKKKILILVSILVVFLAIPPFVNYWVSTPSSIGFIPIEKQEVWISFYASLIGSGITLLGVALTICYTDFTIENVLVINPYDSTIQNMTSIDS